MTKEHTFAAAAINAVNGLTSIVAAFGYVVAIDVVLRHEIDLDAEYAAPMRAAIGLLGGTTNNAAAMATAQGIGADDERE